MICLDCRHGEHGFCPELVRQETGLQPFVAAGSAWCDCQHKDRNAVEEAQAGPGENLPGIPVGGGAGAFLSLLRTG